MLPYSLLFLACALSLDAFSAGFVYGLRRIRVPLFSQLVFLATTLLVVALGVTCGHLLNTVLSPVWSERLGGVILLAIGLWWLVQRREDTSAVEESIPVKTLVDLQFASFKIIIQVLAEPGCADLDSSGVIGARESLLLGIALSLDALGASFGAAVAGFGGLSLILAIGLFQQFFLVLGTCFGRSSSFGWLRREGTIIASIIICLMGLARILHIR